MRSRLPSFLALSAALSVSSLARAGGGPINVLVVYSSDDPDATAVAQHYEKARMLPPGHLCGIKGITPAQTSIDVMTYQMSIQTPVDACIAALPMPDEIDYLVLVRGLPYLVNLPTYTASLEAMLQIGHSKVTATGMDLAPAGQPMGQQASVPNPVFPQGAFFNPADSPIMNQYSAWYALGDTSIHSSTEPESFHRKNMRTSGGYDFTDNLFIVQSLDGFDYKDADALIDRAVTSDGSMPTAEILCMRGEDDARSARDPECELVTRMLTNAGYSGKFVDPFDGALMGHDVAAYFTGSAGSVKNAIAGNTYAPGAITDNLTSFGAAISNFFCNADGSVCPASESQTSIARFIRAGATGAHGTVNEPLNNVFPNAGAMIHYTFGYSMGESYFFNQRFLYWQNIHLGDPLATPYAKRPVVTIEGDATHPVNQPLVVSATHTDGIASIDLYQAGKRVATATSDTLSWPIAGKVGDKLDLLAVAVATNAPVTRTGWPMPMQKPRPDVQGWTAMTVTLGEATMTTSSSGGGGASGTSGSQATTSTDGAGGGDAASGDSGGCGCRTSESASSGRIGLAALAAFIGFARRRRSARRLRRADRTDTSRGRAAS